jgi:hypothetical protein
LNTRTQSHQTTISRTNLLFLSKPLITTITNIICLLSWDIFFGYFRNRTTLPFKDWSRSINKHKGFRFWPRRAFFLFYHRVIPTVYEFLRTLRLKQSYIQIAAHMNNIIMLNRRNNIKIDLIGNGSLIHDRFDLFDSFWTFKPQAFRYHFCRLTKKPSLLIM